MSRKPKEIKSYRHEPVERTTQEPDTKPGDYYVTAFDRASNAGHGRTAFLLGPFRDDHAAALSRVAEARRYVEEHYARAVWWAFGTARLDTADGNPVGKLNETLGMEVAA